MPTPICPTCRGPLEAVRYEQGSMINREQFDSIRAGDWYCTACPGTEAKSGYKYWWDKDLAAEAKPKPSPGLLLRGVLLGVEGAVVILEDIFTLRPRSEYNFDFGTVLWWHLPICEPPLVDCEIPTDCSSSFEPPNYYTHWSPLPDCKMMVASDGAVIHE